MATMTMERDYDIARNEFYGLTDDPSKIVKEIDPKKGHLSYNEWNEILELACDKICQFPSQYKDPDDMIEKECSCCPLAEKLMEFEEE